jgi:hypothetical protein
LKRRRQEIYLILGPLRCLSLGHTGRATHSGDNRSPRSINSIVGRLLSLGLLPIVGIRFLFLGEQPCHRGLRRRSAAVQLADVGAVREHYRCADVRNIRERSLYNGHPPSGPGGHLG